VEVAAAVLLSGVAGGCFVLMLMLLLLVDASCALRRVLASSGVLMTAS
jgi:hypothetical protein